MSADVEYNSTGTCNYHSALQVLTINYPTLTTVSYLLIGITHATKATVNRCLFHWAHVKCTLYR